MINLQTTAAPEEIHRSLDYSVNDGMAYSVMAGAGEVYFAAFALFLKATAAQIGFLSALPPLIGSFAQLLSAWIGQLTGQRRPLILTGVMLQAFSFVPLLLLPILFPAYGTTVLIVCVTIYFALGHLVTPQWCSLMGDIVPEQQRGRYFARRNRLMSITNFIALSLAGIVLHVFEQRGATLTGFVLIFVTALIARLVSLRYLSLMIDLPGHVASIELPVVKEWWKRLHGSRFLRFAVFFALMNFSVCIAAPYFTVYMLRDLQLSYFEFTAITATSVLAQFLTLNSWGRLSDAFGNRLILLVTGFLVPVLPVAWIVSQNIWYLLAIQVLAGLAWAGFSLSTGNYLYDLVPPAKRVTYLSVHNVLAACGVFLGATLGGQLTMAIEPRVVADGWIFGWDYAIYYVFLISTLARFLIIALFLPLIEEVRPTRRPTAGGIVLRATRSPSLAGLVVEYGGSRLLSRKKPG